MSRGAAFLALAGLLARAVPAVAQVGLVPDAPLVFGVAWTRGTPSGSLRDAIDAPQGFTVWLSLPVARRSPLGIRGEFSILTIPEQSLTVPYVLPGGTITLDAAVRGTIGFTGAGPRLALGLGSVELGVAMMAGVIRVITDASAQASSGDIAVSSSASSSDFSYGIKGVVDGYLPVYRGRRGTSVGLAGGFEYLTGGQVGFAERQSFRVGDTGTLTLGRQVQRPTMFVVRAGIGAAF